MRKYKTYDMPLGKLYINQILAKELRDGEQ